MVYVFFLCYLEIVPIAFFQLSYVDIFAFSVLDSFSDVIGETWTKQAPLLGQHRQMVKDLPNIKKWIETRPKTER